MNSKPWHAMTVAEVVGVWKTDLTEGLSSGEVKHRLRQFGNNQLTAGQQAVWWREFLAQFKDFMVLVLLAAAVVAALLGEYADAITIMLIVVLNAVLGFIQEYRAEQSLQALQKMAAPTARVIRNGNIQHIPAVELVPGDILVLEAGDRPAADARLSTTHRLEMEEAALTGESLPAIKVASESVPVATALGDRSNMIYAGTAVSRGRGQAIVCATGMGTEVGCIARMIHTATQEDTPLEKRLEHLGRWLVWGCLAICLVVMATGIVRGEPIFLMCMAGISLAVAAIPEGLPAIVTVSLALGVQRMIQRNAIVRKLPAVETLGCTTVICSDKTGTLTQNAMTVQQVVTAESIYHVSGIGFEPNGRFHADDGAAELSRDSTLRQCLLIGVLCNNSVLKKRNVSISGFLRRAAMADWSIEGDPTEGALIVAAAKAGIWREGLEKTQTRVAEIPFEAERRRMSVVYRTQDGRNTLYVKGAPDTILERCRYYLTAGGVRPMTQDIMIRLATVSETMASQALRVLALAYREEFTYHDEPDGETSEAELIFAGFSGMIDPPRQEVKEAIKVCRQAGIKTIMITGDHRNTAVAIARDLKIYEDGVNEAITGHELDQLDDAALTAAIENITVFARVSPLHKLRIVRSLKQAGHVVAMTGDGVNDAPAIKEADIGVAMGRSGTDVAREAAAMVLADDNFATIVAAVEEGRGIYDNIRKFIRYLLACNTGEVLTMFGAALVGLPLPFLPVQLLWINLVTDGIPAMALGVDPVDPAVMKRSPRNPRESVFSRGLHYKIFARGLQVGCSTLLIFALVYWLQHDLVLARTMAFATLVLCQMFHVFDCRSETASIFEVGFLSNKYLLAGVFSSLLMLLAVIYHPVLSGVFTTVPLSLHEWSLVLLVSGWTFFRAWIKYVLFHHYPFQSVFSKGH